MNNVVSSREAVGGLYVGPKRTLQNRIDAISHRVEYRRMVDFEDREAVFHLRRNAYSRHKGEANDWGATSIDPRHEPNSETVGVFLDGKLVASSKITVVTAEFPDSQSRNFFPEEVGQRLAGGNVIIDPGRLVTDTRAAKQNSELPYLAMKISAMACQYYDADECFFLIRQEHQSFYERFFDGKLIAGPKWYEPLEIQAVLMCSKVDEVRESILDRFPFWRASRVEMRQLFGPVDAIPALKALRDKAA